MIVLLTDTTGHPHRMARGFTLIEMMLAIAILAVIMAMMAS
ncbi:MAG: PulJ/GspJ family protein, partial [Candidatus Binataceae bacterium]